MIWRNGQKGTYWQKENHPTVKKSEEHGHSMPEVEILAGSNNTLADSLDIWEEERMRHT